MVPSAVKAFVTLGLWCVVTVSQGACHVEEELRTVGFVNICSKASSLKQNSQSNISSFLAAV